MALLLKPARPTPSNTRSLISFQRYTQRNTMVLQYWKVLQRGRTNECQWATKAPQVTFVGTNGKGNALLRGCIGLLFILVVSAIELLWPRHPVPTLCCNVQGLAGNLSYLTIFSSLYDTVVLQDFNLRYALRVRVAGYRFWSLVLLCQGRMLRDWEIAV